ncbi:MAG: hypothetical protein R6U85_07315 [Salinivirgaceae bacterium]
MSNRTISKQLKKTFQAFLYVLVFAILAPNAMGQKSGNQLLMKNNYFSGNKYYKGVWSITQEKAFNIMKENGEAYQLAMQGKKLQTISMVVNITGGVLIGYPLGAALGGAEDPMFFLAGIGAGIVLLGIPIYSSANRKIHQAIEVYNESIETAYYKNTRFIKEIKLTAGSAGIGLAARF